ncbi:MAG: 30S ribosomal protein S3 [Candidatus Gottesmanbacteria bacterium GW2011_GWB1_49_7]|uniref:Small ribosomal subunit protein uS3 n=2 Tax=root TaxID=1 RepID=A0A0G1VYL0_9BACT|nr:30S ribosomal protein S3 [uncultured organism]KKW11208.1 MAG: 30S ribosomal protein S3, small subunit ribosomal protein S3 [Microgenomates group bacterium GW2011_GWC1_49_7]KKW11430.1 MAG: 30S ribosomal protein S3 [Candidatus Gottesmanbacteria bacterium GW2011_GWB1_49_7]
MGQKINPKGFRIGTTFTWGSRWFADSRRYKHLLLQDAKLRSLLFARLKSAGLAAVDIERSINKVKITLFVSRPGVVIGRGGAGLDDLKKYIEKTVLTETGFVNPYERGSKMSQEANRSKVEVAVEPVKEPNLNAHLVATNVADQLIKRMPYKRICNQAVERAMTAGAKGVRVLLSGRINGAEIHRREKFQSGTVPLSTIREEIDFAIVPALTKSGYIGVKVWICRKG